MEKKENIDELICLAEGFYITKAQLEEIKESEEAILRGEGIPAEIAFEELMRTIEEERKSNCSGK